MQVDLLLENCQINRRVRVLDLDFECPLFNLDFFHLFLDLQQFVGVHVLRSIKSIENAWVGFLHEIGQRLCHQLLRSWRLEFQIIMECFVNEPGQVYREVINFHLHFSSIRARSSAT